MSISAQSFGRGRATPHWYVLASDAAWQTRDRLHASLWLQWGSSQISNDYRNRRMRLLLKSILANCARISLTAMFFLCYWRLSTLCKNMIALLRYNGVQITEHALRNLMYELKLSLWDLFVKRVHWSSDCANRSLLNYTNNTKQWKQWCMLGNTFHQLRICIWKKYNAQWVCLPSETERQQPNIRQDYILSNKSWLLW